MKIVHICISERYVEGDSYHENILPTKHQKMGHTVTVIGSQEYFDGRTKSMKHRETADYVNKDGIHVIILPSAKGGVLYDALVKTVKGLYETITTINPDVVFVHGVGSPDNRAVARYVKHHKNVKLFADNHNDYNVTPIRKGFKHKIYRVIGAYNARLLLPYAEKFWGTIPLRVDYLNKVFRIPRDKTDVLIMGGEDDLIINKNVEQVRNNIRKYYGIPKEAFLVVTGGAFDKRKQQNLLMEAIKELNNDSIWLIAFGEPVKGMKAVFEPYMSEKRIMITGWLPSDYAYDLFLASDLAFFPGWHSVLWEQAVACGIPLVVKKWDGVDHVNYNGNAVLLEKVDVEIIKDTIKDLFNTPKYKKMQELAKEAAPNFFMSNIANKAIGL